MAITTKLQPRYTIKTLAFIVICLVLGLWGVWDYAVKIPQQQRDYERWQTVLAVKTALETQAGNPDRADRNQQAWELVKRELSKPLRDAAQTAGVALDLENDIERLGLYTLLFPMIQGEEARDAESLGLPPEMQEEDIVRLADALADPLVQHQQIEWVRQLLFFNEALKAAQRMPRTETRPLQGVALKVYEETAAYIDRIGEVTPPHAYDRLIQWAFIACLPFVPWYAFRYVQMRRVKYTLDDEGNLHSPLGAWEHDKIADIDMSRWMSKSIAEIVHEDGTRLKIDDYVHRDAHLIVGAIASEKHPDEWDEEGKKVKPADETGEPTDDEAADLEGLENEATDEQALAAEQAPHTEDQPRR